MIIRSNSIRINCAGFVIVIVIRLAIIRYRHFGGTLKKPRHCIFCLHDYVSRSCPIPLRKYHKHTTQKACICNSTFDCCCRLLPPPLLLLSLLFAKQFVYKIFRFLIIVLVLSLSLSGILKSIRMNSQFCFPLDSIFNTFFMSNCWLFWNIVEISTTQIINNTVYLKI